MNDGMWQIWIDTGGTFTDCLATNPAGTSSQLKVLSSGSLKAVVVEQMDPWAIRVILAWPAPGPVFKNFLLGLPGRSEPYPIASVDTEESVIRIGQRAEVPRLRPGTIVRISSGEEVPVFACRLLTQTPIGAPFPKLQLKLGSTKGTNALLERNGAPTALLITRGFRDLLEIGDQRRPDLFSLKIEKPRPLYHAVIEVDERMQSDGSVLHALAVDELQRIAGLLKRRRIKSVAVALLHSYKNPAHEQIIMDALERQGFEHISMSHELASQIRILPRAETAVVNAYLAPVIRHYLDTMTGILQHADIRIMSSAGGLTAVSHFHPKDSLLSGPAGGVIGAQHMARQSGIERIITFDMGGTSTDVSLCDRRPAYRFACRVGEHQVLAPGLAIETIAAGGGSICFLDGRQLKVGPRSAGASPGPACYGSGGPLTITDINLLLGRLNTANFSIPIRVDDASREFGKLVKKLRRSWGRKGARTEDILSSFIQIANEKMAEAIRKVSTHRGIDPHHFAMVCFGGAGGQHACALAGMLGITTILVPLNAGVLSAFGIGNAQEEQICERFLLEPLEQLAGRLESVFESLAAEARNALEKQGHRRDAVQVRDRLLFMRFAGQESSVEVTYRSWEQIADDFMAAYRKTYGHWIAGRPVEVEAARLRAAVVVAGDSKLSDHPGSAEPEPMRMQHAYLNGWMNIPVFSWDKMQPGAGFKGPAMLLGAHTTILVDRGWHAQLESNKTVVLSRKPSRKVTPTRLMEEAKLELFTNRFTAVAEEMGALLQRTACSVNVKERLDFSCAVLDAAGRLIVNAPHIPVHLGSLGVCVRSLRKAGLFRDGDVVITNHPQFGGSHLPDVTLVRPVYHGGALLAFVANRAHHAEIGGKQPGSMPSDAGCLAEEGVVIRPTHLIRDARAYWDEVERILRTAPFPSRAIRENMADLQAGLAALTLGAAEMEKLCEEFGMREIKRYMRMISQHAGERMRQALRRIPKGTYRALEHLDDGSAVAVKVVKQAGRLTLDFTGSAPQHPGNLNATEAIVQSVVLYVLRMIAAERLPLNEGLLDPVRIVVPRGILRPRFSGDDFQCPAVVGGNTELSQRLTDTILKALKVAACSQGTMNNLLFGDDQFGYYETIAGGTGAGPGFHGADGVHHHMTNTKITDPEILEWRYPVRVERFEVRKNSGGRGRWRGGDGLIRTYCFMAPLDLTILSQHRTQRPYGMRGGAPGLPGRQYIVRAAGGKEALKGIDGARVLPGDRLVVLTPGGGGYGRRSQG